MYIVVVSVQIAMNASFACSNVDKNRDGYLLIVMIVFKINNPLKYFFFAYKLFLYAFLFSTNYAVIFTFILLGGS